MLQKRVFVWRLALLLQISASENGTNSNISPHKLVSNHPLSRRSLNEPQFLTCLSTLPEVGLSSFRENIPLPDRKAAGVTVDAAPDPAGVDFKRVRERVNRAETRRDLEPARIGNRLDVVELGVSVDTTPHDPRLQPYERARGSSQLRGKLPTGPLSATRISTWDLQMFHAK